MICNFFFGLHITYILYVGKDTNNSRNLQAFRELFVVRLLKSIECRFYTFSIFSTVWPVTCEIIVEDTPIFI